MKIPVLSFLVKENQADSSCFIRSKVNGNYGLLVLTKYNKLSIIQKRVAGHPMPIECREGDRHLFLRACLTGD